MFAPMHLCAAPVGRPAWMSYFYKVHLCSLVLVVHLCLRGTYKALGTGVSVCVCVCGVMHAAFLYNQGGCWSCVWMAWGAMSLSS